LLPCVSQKLARSVSSADARTLPHAVLGAIAHFDDAPAGAIARRTATLRRERSRLVKLRDVRVSERARSFFFASRAPSPCAVAVRRGGSRSTFLIENNRVTSSEQV